MNQEELDFAAMKDPEADFYNDVNSSETFKIPTSLYEAILAG